MAIETRPPYEGELEPEESVITSETFTDLGELISAVEDSIRESSATDEEKKDMLKKIEDLETQLRALKA